MTSARKRRLALAQLPARMREATALFRELTGFLAVTSLSTEVVGPSGGGTLVPPMHPECAVRLRRTRGTAPCEVQWRWHLRSGRDEHASQSHVCPLGLRCSCVPIFFGDTLVGIAKVVADPATIERRFTFATRALELLVTRICQDFRVSSLEEEIEELRGQVASMRRVGRRAGATQRVDEPASAAHDGSLIDRTLSYLDDHYSEPHLSLVAVGRALGVNGKYLTQRFTAIVGQHMHAYIRDLRVNRACRLLLSTDMQIKRIASEGGFRSAEGFRRVFQEHVGVSPGTYRKAFHST